MDVESSIILLGRTPCSVKSVMQKVGDSIFANESTLEKELRDLNAPEFADAKDRLFLLVLKKIPSSMYDVKSFSDGEPQEVLEACQKRLCVDLGLSFEPCAQMLDILQEYIWQKRFSLSPNLYESQFVDPRDGQVYKTVRIGDQVWKRLQSNVAQVSATISLAISGRLKISSALNFSPAA